jgi:phosphocarrier protein HPr
LKNVLLSICNERGLHARTAAKFVRLVNQFSADVTVSKDGQKVTGHSILGLMTLAAAIGDTIEVSASGIDEAAALEAITGLIANKFGEN